MTRKVINFGKVDYNRSGRKNCRVTIEVELYALNDVLTQFFADKRDYEPPQSLAQRTTVITADDPDFA